MSWFKRDKGDDDKLPKLDDKDRKVRTEGLWQKCEGCRQIIWKKDLETNWNVCPKCGAHSRIDAVTRLKLLLDDGQYTRCDTELRSSDPLGFVDSKPYSERLKSMQQATKLSDAMIAAEGRLCGRPLQVCAMEPRFIGGSMGSVVGEMIMRAIERSIANRQPLLIVSASGGARTTHLGIVAYNVTDQAYNEGRGREYHQRAVEKAAAVHGVISAALGRDIPFHVASTRTVLLDGQDPSAARQGRSTLTSVVSPGYFQTMGIALVRGHDFRPADTKTTPRVVIVNATAAAAYWPGRDPVGQHISFAGEGLPVEVIGIVKTANYLAIAEPPQPLVYLSLVQYYFPTAVLYV